MSQEPFSVVHAGCGGIARTWLTYAVQDPRIRLAGLVDVNPQAAAALRDEFGLDAAVGADLEAMLAQVQPQVLFDCTIPAAHTAVTLTGLAHGCHVLGEKPMAESMADARGMVAAAEEAGRIYAVIQNRRYQPRIVQFRDLVGQGTLGALTTLNADFYIGAHFGGFRDAMEHVLILDMAIHTFDQARFISGADPVSVYCHEWNPAGSWYAHGASAVAIFEMSNGLVFTYRGSWCGEGFPTTWECSWRAVGSKGSALWDGADDLRAEVVAGDEGFMRPRQAAPLPPLRAMAQTNHAGVIHDFITCLQEGRTPQTVCTDNIKSLAMVHGAIESAESGRKVSINWGDA